MRKLIAALALAAVPFWHGAAQAQGDLQPAVIGCLTHEIVEPRQTGVVVAFALLTAKVERGRFSKNTRTVYLMFMPDQILLSNLRTGFELDTASRARMESMISMLRTASQAARPVTVMIPRDALTLDRPVVVPEIDVHWTGMVDGQEKLTCEGLT